MVDETTVMMEARNSSESQLTSPQPTRRHISEGSNLHSHLKTRNRPCSSPFASPNFSV